MRSLALALTAVAIGFQVNVATTSRTWEDASVVQFSITPKTRAKVHVHGHVRRAGVSASTMSATTVSAALRYAATTGSDAFVDRPLTRSQRKRWHSRLAWIDGDVLAVNPANPLCTRGTTMAGARSLLTRAAAGAYFAPAGLTGDPELLFGLQPGRSGASPYGPAVETVDEERAVAAVASDPGAVAFVAWSATRAALDAHTVCAVPLGGIAPSEATLRDGSYPATVRATYVWRRGHHAVTLPGWARTWYLRYLRSAKVEHLLETARGRDRLLP
jgi:hypothetical protein